MTVLPPPPDGELCKEIAATDSRIRYYEKQNEGIGATRNKGISLARGEYIACLDQDDEWAGGFLDEELAALLDGKTDVFSFDVYSCDESLAFASYETGKSTIFSGGSSAAQSIRFHHSAHFYRRAFLEKNRLGYALTRHEDVIFLHKTYYLAQNITHIQKPMLLYRNNPASETHRKQAAEQLYIPLISSWLELHDWFQATHPEDLDILRWCDHMTCVYGMEGIEALYQSGRSDREIERIFSTYPCKALLDDYRNVMLSENRIIQIGEFYNDRKRFAKKNRRIARRMRIGMWIKRNIPFVEKIHIRKKYPLILDQSLISK